MIDKRFYAISFDNDPDFPGLLQWVNVGEYYGEATNLTESLDVVMSVFDSVSSEYPSLNYRVHQLTAQEIEP